MEHSIMERFLWNGLDLVKYEVRKIIPQNQSDAVVIMQSHIPSDKHWCLEYRGSGHYFSTFSELETYYKHRFKKDLMEDFTMNNFVFPIYKSNTVNAYRNTFGQFDKDSLEKKGDFDFCLREEKSGKFTLERITEGKIPNAHRMTVICPHHDQHRMTAIDNQIFICTECDPRLSH